MSTSNFNNLEIFSFEELSRITEVLFLPAGYSVQIKDKDHKVLWEDSKTAKSEGDHTGLNCYTVNFGRSEACQNCVMKQAISSFQAQIKEEINLKDKCWYEVIALPIIFSDEVVALELIRKIPEERTGRKSLDTMIKLGKFITDIIYHDFPNYLNNIQLTLELLEKQFSFQDESAILVNKIMETTNNLTAIINDLRVIRILDDPLKKVTVKEVRETIEDVLSDLKRLFPQKEIDTEFEFKNLDINLSIQANNLLSVLFLNLLKNSIKHTLSKKVRIIIELRKQDTSSNSSSLLIIISDWGKGINPDIKDSLFDRAQRIQSGWQTSKDSSGLGTSIIKTIIEIFQGEIYYEDRVQGKWEEGTKVKVFLPIVGM